MKIVIAPNALKGSLSASAAAAALAGGVRSALPGVEIAQLPVSDGGDGLIDVVATALGAERRRVRVCGPRFAPVAAEFAWLPARRIAVIEMALASGLALLDSAARDPTATTTRGTGELLRAALDLGAEQVYIGLGGSATTDGGIGLADVLGWRFLDARGEPVRPIGAALGGVARIDGSGADPRIARTRIDALCDVDNPLTGAEGSARVFAPQKGADPQQVQQLDDGLTHLAARIARDLGKVVAAVPRGGAAGGLGAGLLAFCDARLRAGAEVVLDLVGLDGHLADADLVLTAEGQVDDQTLFGKAPGAVASRAAARGIPCFAIAGGVGDGLQGVHEAGITAVFSLCDRPMSLRQAQQDSPRLLRRAAEQVLRAFLAGRLEIANRNNLGN